MKRQDLRDLGLEKDVIDSIMALHGQTVNKHQTSIAALTTERDELKLDAYKYQATSKTLEEVQGNLDAYVVDEQNREFQTKLTGFDIIGLYQPTDPTAERDLFVLFASPEVINYLQDEKNYLNIQINVQNPRNLNELHKEISHITANYHPQISTNDQLFTHLIGPLESLNALFTGLIFATFAISTAVITLLLILWVKERSRETGILLAIGVTKTNLFIQRLFEVGTIYLISFLVSTVLIFIFLPSLTKWIFPIAQTSIIVTGHNLVVTFVVGIVVACVSITISAISMIRLKPRDVLSRVD